MIAGATGGGVALLYAAVYLLARPSGFEVQGGQVRVVFPVWSRDITGVVKAERVDTAELKRRYGLLLRVGAGGLWGGFGWLWSRRGWVEFYVSRMDDYVLLTRSEGLPLLINAEDPDLLCERVAAAPGSPSQPG